jgi:hypothetical protein
MVPATGIGRKKVANDGLLQDQTIEPGGSISDPRGLLPRKRLGSNHRISFQREAQILGSAYHLKTALLRRGSHGKS